MSHINKGDVHAYLDGALGAYPEEAARHVREHLDACRECAQLLESERRLRQEASAILAASAQEPVELDPLEKLLARAAEPDGQERAKGAESSERSGRARTALGSRLYSLRWAATIVVSLGAGWMARELTGPAGDAARGAMAEPIVTEIEVRPASDRERSEGDNVGGFAEAESPPESQAAPAGRFAGAETAPESPDASVVVGDGLSADRAASGYDDDAQLDQVVVSRVQERADPAAARGVVPIDANVSAPVVERAVGTALLSDEPPRSARSRSAQAVDRRDRASLTGAVAQAPSAAASPSTTPLWVPGLQVLDIRVAPKAEGLAGGPGGSVVVTQELADGRVVELQFVPLAGNDPVLDLARQEQDDFLGLTRPEGWSTVVRNVPEGLAILSGPLTPRELEDLLDRVLGPR